MSTSSDGRPTDAGISVFSTLEAFKSGLTATLSRAAGADVCRGWVAKLDAHGDTRLNGVRAGLDALADLLERDDATGADLGGAMEALGAHTEEVASLAGADHLQDALGRLGGYLRATGTALAGGERPDTIQGISTDRGATPGDPTLRSANLAPDLSDDRDQNAGEVREDVVATPGDETPGTALNPH